MAYAPWGGLGIVLTVMMGYFVLHQPIDKPAVAGIALMVTGVLVINIFSRTVTH